MLLDLLLFTISILIGYFFSDYLIVKKAKRWHGIGKRGRYHVHHSVYGLILFLLVPLAYDNISVIVTLLGLGSGIIAEHTYHESFIFIEREHR